MCKKWGRCRRCKGPVLRYPSPARCRPVSISSPRTLTAWPGVAPLPCRRKNQKTKAVLPSPRPFCHTDRSVLTKTGRASRRSPLAPRCRGQFTFSRAPEVTSKAASTTPYHPANRPGPGPLSQRFAKPGISVSPASLLAPPLAGFLGHQTPSEWPLHPSWPLHQT